MNSNDGVKPSNEELLPCPFCSGVAEVIRHGTHYQSCVVACRDCGCRHESNEQGAGREWNTRAELQRRQQPEASVPAELVARWHAEACLAWPEHAAQPWGFTKFSTEYLANKAAAYGRGQSALQSARR